MIAILSSRLVLPPSIPFLSLSLSNRDNNQSLFKLVLGFAQHELLAPLIDHVPPKSSGAKTELETSTASSGDGDSSSSKGKGKGRASSDEDLAVVGADGEGEAEDEDEDVSVAELLASANRQAKVFAQAPGAGDGKGGDAGTLAFALQVCASCVFIYLLLPSTALSG